MSSITNSGTTSRRLRELVFGQTPQQAVFELKTRVCDGDPVALYQAIRLCSDNKLELPRWLTDKILDVMVNYLDGNKPGRVGAGKTPLAKIRKRLERDVKLRALQGVREWQLDKLKYQLLPTKSYDAWAAGRFDHASHQTWEHAYKIVRIGLDGVRIRKDGPTLKCSDSTLRRIKQGKDHNKSIRIPGEFATAFGFNDPDEFFGTDHTPPQSLLAD